MQQQTMWSSSAGYRSTVAAQAFNGIRFLAGAQLTVEHCIIDGFINNGIDINMTSASDVYVTNSYITKVTKGVVATSHR